MTRILGIDPGSIRTGYGIIEDNDKGQYFYIDHGYISTPNKEMNYRLLHIYQSLIQVIERFQPKEAAIEQVFMHQNPQSALKLGQARGVAIIAATQNELVLSEYSPRKIKQSIVGYGAASKVQIQQMIKILLKMPDAPQADAADALAIALCHCYHRRFNIKLNQGRRHPAPRIQSGGSRDPEVLSGG